MFALTAELHEFQSIKPTYSWRAVKLLQNVKTTMLDIMKKKSLFFKSDLDKFKSAAPSIMKILKVNIPNYHR